MLQNTSYGLPTPEGSVVFNTAAHAHFLHKKRSDFKAKQQNAKDASLKKRKKVTMSDFPGLGDILRLTKRAYCANLLRLNPLPDEEEKKEYAQEAFYFVTRGQRVVGMSYWIIDICNV